MARSATRNHAERRKTCAWMRVIFNQRCWRLALCAGNSRRADSDAPGLLGERVVAFLVVERHVDLVIDADAQAVVERERVVHLSRTVAIFAPLATALAAWSNAIDIGNPGSELSP